MKKNNLLVLGIAIIFSFSMISFASCNDEESNEEQTETVLEEINPENLVKVNFNVNGMTCEGCEKAVDNSIMKLAGINHTKVSHIDSIAIVEYDKTQTNEDDIKKAIADAGYTVVE